MDTVYNIYLAIGSKSLEDYIKSTKKVMENYSNKQIAFVGEAVYKEGVIQGIKDTHPNIVIISETLAGSMEISTLIENIRYDYPEIRIIFISNDRLVGDALLANLVSSGVYDLIIGSNNVIQVKDIIKRVIYPNKYSDVAYLKPKIVVNEKDKNILFESSDNHPREIAPISIKEDNKELPVKPMNNSDKLDEIAQKISKKQCDNTNKIKEEELEVYNQSEQDDEVYDDNEVGDSSDEIIQIDEEEENNNFFVNAREFMSSKRNNNRKVEETDEEYIEENMDKGHEEEQRIPTSINTQRHTSTNTRLNKSTKQERNAPPRINKNNNEKQNNTNKKNKPNLLSSIFKASNKNKDRKSKKITQQINLFVGGSRGVGNSQLSFNTAISIASKGYDVLYIDLNEHFSSIDSIFQLGYSDSGVDTAIKEFVNRNYSFIDKSISNMNKILTFTTPDNYLYDIYQKIPKNIDFLVYSQDYMELKNSGDINKDDGKYINETNVVNLLTYLMVNKSYDSIIIDVPAESYNDPIVSTLLAYVPNIFFTITQDSSIISNFLNNLKLVRKNRINFEEKSYYLLNKYEHVGFDVSEISNILAEELRISNLKIITIPNINKDLIEANYKGIPVIWHTKSKEFQNAIINIENLII